MIEPWNDPTIMPPPVSTILHSYKYDVTDISHACNNAIKVLLKQSPLHKESAILSRFVYKFDKKFRNDIGYRILKKINTALRRYLTLNLLKDIENFVAVIPTKEDDQYYLPTRQMLEYIMIRIMTFSKIMMRICVCSKQSSIYYMNRIKRGESHWMSLMPYALLSRVLTMSTVLLHHSCSWYNSLYPHLKLLQSKGLDFLPNGYSLPKSLEVWLDIGNLDSFGRFNWSHKKSIQCNLEIEEDSEMTFDNILDYVKDINSEDSNKQQIGLVLPKLQESLQKPTATITTTPATLEVDQGVAISREYFQSFFNKNNDKDNVKHIHSADNVIDKTTLDTFISKEEDFRIENGELSLTKHLSFMQWQSLRTSLVNLSNMLFKNRKIERKFKKIWKEKCLDYQ